MEHSKEDPKLVTVSTDDCRGYVTGSAPHNNVLSCKNDTVPLGENHPVKRIHIQHFEDGSTRVICHDLENGQCRIARSIRQEELAPLFSDSKRLEDCKLDHLKVQPTDCPFQLKEVRR